MYFRHRLELSQIKGWVSGEVKRRQTKAMRLVVSGALQEQAQAVEQQEQEQSNAGGGVADQSQELVDAGGGQEEVDAGGGLSAAGGVSAADGQELVVVGEGQVAAEGEETQGGAGPGDWIECEVVDCTKWRIVPAGHNYPAGARFFCSMLPHGSCEIQEDQEEDDDEMYLKPPQLKPPVGPSCSFVPGPPSIHSTPLHHNPPQFCRPRKLDGTSITLKPMCHGCRMGEPPTQSGDGTSFFLVGTHGDVRNGTLASFSVNPISERAN